MGSEASISVRADRNRHSDWEVAMPDQASPVACETLDDARRIAYLSAARGIRAS